MGRVKWGMVQHGTADRWMITMNTLLLVAALVAGFTALAWSADRFVAGASATATHFGLPTLLVGLTVIGIGTSLPEMLVSGIAALEGTPEIALGNALGSNIANVGLILGLTAMVTPVFMDPQLLRREFPVLMLVVVGTGLLLADAALSRADGLLLLGGMVAVLAWMAREARRGDAHARTLTQEIDESLPSPMPISRAIVALIVGLAVLLGSSHLLVWSATEIARLLGVSELVIGLSIVAVGTSLPELAAATASVRRGDHGLVIGNIIGSNLFNLLAVLGIAAVLAPFTANGPDLIRDYAAMTAFMLALIGAGFVVGRRGRCGRLSAALLLAGYGSYQIMLFWTGH